MIRSVDNHAIPLCFYIKSFNHRLSERVKNLRPFIQLLNQKITLLYNVYYMCMCTKFCFNFHNHFSKMHSFYWLFYASGHFVCSSSRHTLCCEIMSLHYLFSFLVSVWTNWGQSYGYIILIFLAYILLGNNSKSWLQMFKQFCKALIFHICKCEESDMLSCLQSNKWDWSIRLLGKKWELTKEYE